MNYIVSIEGQSIPMPEEVAADDNKLKAALSPYFPGAANAKIMRSEAKDDSVTVTVIKQAGTKGAECILDRLIRLPESRNPVAELYERLADIDAHLVGYSPEEMLALDGEISEAQTKGGEQHDAMGKTFRLLMKADSQPSQELPEGF